MKHTFLLLLTVLLARPESSSAQQLFDVNFNSLQTGSPPSAGGASHEPTQVVAEPNTECLVVGSYAGLTDQPKPKLGWALIRSINL